MGTNTTKIEVAYQTHSEILFGHLYVFLYFCAHQKRAVVIAVSDSSKKAIERNTIQKATPLIVKTDQSPEIQRNKRDLSTQLLSTL